MPFDPTYPSIPLLNFVGFVLALLPLPSMLHSWNVGACAFSVWAALQCLDTFIRTVVWRDTSRIIAPVYCDISIRFQLAANAAIPACSLAINHSLYRISHKRGAPTTQRWKSILVDFLICVGYPLLQPILFYVVQNIRFAIAEQVGCRPVVEDTILSLIILNVMCILPTLISIVYTPFNVLSFLKKRQQMDIFYKSNSSMSRSHYVRLMALSSFDVLVTLPVNTAILALTFIEFKSDPTAGAHLLNWPGWTQVHAHLSLIQTADATLWRTSKIDVTLMYINYYLNFLWAVAFFAFFGTTKEMMLNYRRILNRFKGIFERRPAGGLKDICVGSNSSGTGDSSVNRPVVVIGQLVETVSFTSHSSYPRDKRDSKLFSVSPLRNDSERSDSSSEAIDIVTENV